VSTLFVGLMSGTSLDGADAVLVDFVTPKPRTLAFATVGFSADLRDCIMALSQPGSDPLDLAGTVSVELAKVYAQAVEDVIAAAGVPRAQIAAVGCHGQTVRHRPEKGFTIQLNDPARLAELIGLDVVADFRRRDIAAGGQGAPLVPAFHEAIFRDAARSRVVVNIGGISNVTCLPASGRTLGFDCGPGNMLLDAWAHKHIGTLFDEGGTWAATGRIDPSLLARFMDEPFLALAPPKSTGRELFHLAWLQERLPRDFRAVDVQSTLTEFTAQSITDAIDRHCPDAAEIYLAGGGARNSWLVARIKALARTRTVATTDALGVPTSHVESMAFAWLAMKCIHREPIDLTAITGAREPRILGAVYPA
jgi:anhydro-N-acetylmuramic acid kinase